MVRIAFDAGHGMNTSGKRSPSNEREWNFNNVVVNGFYSEMIKYSDCVLLRCDDPTGVIDVALKDRVIKANNWKADIYISFHHNANTGQWGNWSGVETFAQPSPTTLNIVKLLHPVLVNSYGLKDRGIKNGSHLYIIRNTAMKAILFEGGFMDSTIDILTLRNSEKLKQAGINIGKSLADYYNLTLKNNFSNSTQPLNKKLKVITRDLYTYNTPNWKDKGVVVHANEVFTIVGELMVNGSKMYKLKSGKYITANKKYVEVL